MLRGSARALARGASLVEIVVVVGLVALAAIGSFKLFSGNVNTTTTDLGNKVRSLEGNTAGPTPTNTSAGSFAAPSNKNGPSCDPVRGCGGGNGAGGATNPNGGAAPVDLAERSRIDAIVRDLFQRPLDSRTSVLRGLSPSDFNAVTARIQQLDSAFIALQNANDPAYSGFISANQAYEGEANGLFSLFRGGSIATAQAARSQALDALLTRSFATLDAGRGAPPGTPGGGGEAFAQLGDLLLRSSVAPDFAGVSMSAADRARTWEIQRSRDAEAAQIRSFGDFVMTQPRPVQQAVAQGQQDFLAQIRASLPEAARADFDRFFTAHTVVVDGRAEYRLTPTDDLRRLQDQQASMIGVDINGYQSNRTVPFNAPSNGQEAFAWWLTYGMIDPRALSARYNPPPSDAINTADEVFALIPVGTAVTVVRGIGAFTIREIAAMATREVLTNVAITGVSAAVAEKYGPLAGSGVGVAAVVLSLVSHRVVTVPNVVAAAERFGGCFVAGTLIATAAGPMPIEKIEVGMHVLTRDADTKAIDFRPVVKTFVKHDKAIVRLALEDVASHAVETLGVTEEHPFWLEGQGWTKAVDLVPGARLSTAVGAVLVRSLSLERATQDVYNFEVEGTHSYFVGHLETWAHNLCEALIARLVRQTEGGTFEIARRNFPGVGDRIVGRPDAVVANDAATEAAAAIALAREPGVVRVYVGAEADALFIETAQRAGVQVPTRTVNGVVRVDAPFPDVIAVNARGQWILAEGKGANIGHVGEQFETVSRFLPGRVSAERVYTSSFPVNGDLGALGTTSRLRLVNGRAMEVVVVNPGESTAGLTRWTDPVTGAQLWVRPWKPNGRIVVVNTPDRYRPVLDR